MNHKYMCALDYRSTCIHQSMWESRIRETRKLRKLYNENDCMHLIKCSLKINRGTYDHDTYLLSFRLMNIKEHKIITYSIHQLMNFIFTQLRSKLVETSLEFFKAYKAILIRIHHIKHVLKLIHFFTRKKFCNNLKINNKPLK